jgi:hypothetical protein
VCVYVHKAQGPRQQVGALAGWLAGAGRPFVVGPPIPCCLMHGAAARPGEVVLKGTRMCEGQLQKEGLTESLVDNLLSSSKITSHLSITIEV